MRIKNKIKKRGKNILYKSSEYLHVYLEIIFFKKNVSFFGILIH